MSEADWGHFECLHDKLGAHLSKNKAVSWLKSWTILRQLKCRDNFSWRPHKKWANLILLLSQLRRTGGRKTPARTFRSLNYTDTLTVYRRNRGNFSQLPVRDTLSTYPSASLKTKAVLPSVFILCLRRLASHISHKSSACKRGKSVNITLKLVKVKHSDRKIPPFPPGKAVH